MRSSGSTPSRSPRRRLPLYLVLANEDHPRACTGRRLIRRGVVRALDEGRRWPSGLLLLDPFAPTPLAPSDRKSATGLLAVDCSWNRLRARGSYPGDGERLDRWRFRRRLPWLLAGNAQHYGRLGQLNTAEALAAALYVLGEPDFAREILSVAGTGMSLFSLNRGLLESYRSASTVGALQAEERAYF